MMLLNTFLFFPSQLEEPLVGIAGTLVPAKMPAKYNAVSMILLLLYMQG